MAAGPDFRGLMEWLPKGGRWPVRMFSKSLSDTCTPTFVPATLLWLLTVGAILGVDAVYWQSLRAAPVLIMGAMFLIYLWAYQALFLVGCVSSRRGGGMLGFGLVVVVIVVPAIFSNIEGLGSLINATPFGMMGWEVMYGRYLLGDSPMPDALYQSILCAACQFGVFGLIATLGFVRISSISPRRGKVALQAGRS